MSARGAYLGVIAALAFAAPLAAETPRERAARLLEAGEIALSAAEGPQARLAALGQAAQAQEAVLAALRLDLRALDARERALKDAMAERERTFRAVLAALERLQRSPRMATLAHPGGAVAAARAGMALSAFTPALETEAARLRVALTEVSALASGRDRAAAASKTSLAALQEMRTDIAALMDRERDRNRLPAATRERIAGEAARLGQTAATLRALSADLPAGAAAAPTGAAPAINARKGAIDPPVEAVIVAGFGEADDGMTLDAPAYAALYAPWDGVIRFAGPFADRGGVVILEPEPGLLFVFAGLGETSRMAGETVLKGEPIGAMGGPPPAAEEFLIVSREGVEALTPERLYIEVRENGAPVDPAAWFAFANSEGDGT